MLQILTYGTKSHPNARARASLLIDMCMGSIMTAHRCQLVSFPFRLFILDGLCLHVQPQLRLIKQEAWSPSGLSHRGHCNLEAYTAYSNNTQQRREASNLSLIHI